MDTPTTADRWAPLTPTDRERLIAYKYRYRLQAGEYGTRFTQAESKRLVFQLWLASEGHYADDSAPEEE